MVKRGALTLLTVVKGRVLKRKPVELVLLTDMLLLAKPLRKGARTRPVLHQARVPVSGGRINGRVACWCRLWLWLCL